MSSQEILILLCTIVAIVLLFNFSKKLNKSKKGQKNIYLGITGGCLGYILGLVISQFIPLWGNQFQKMADPFTDMKLQLVFSHVLLFIIIGFIVPFLMTQIKKK